MALLRPSSPEAPHSRGDGRPEVQDRPSAAVTFVSTFPSNQDRGLDFHYKNTL
ncbi:hypothetical protein MA16_Dca010853 [Dendrobium catenatum]|uniref:Uncharacterized protein n=1 Tax=Dendrobium catenatum TaxID=906689 RepID=A0A2I0XFD5_9ASPA|nr:hypothetical protein MA16_Dca010853 [Dendrobium catenatum]